MIVDNLLQHQESEGESCLMELGSLYLIYMKYNEGRLNEGEISRAMSLFDKFNRDYPGTFPKINFIDDKVKMHEN